MGGKDHPCYVIHVKEGYEDREQSIREQFSKLGLDFEWILDHDVPDLTDEVLKKYGYKGTKLQPAEISCSLKHIEAWERLASGNSSGALVFEDDVLIDLKNFQDLFKKTISELNKNVEAEAYVSLGDGCAMYVPWTRMNKGQHLYPAEQVRATDSYFLTRGAAEKMLGSIREEGFFLPADHLINRLCRQLGIPILWLAPTLASQGSHTGRFASQIQSWDKGEIKEKIKWVIKKIRRKYIYPLLGEDPRQMEAGLRADLDMIPDEHEEDAG